jgi:hypothetical protein
LVQFDIFSLKTAQEEEAEQWRRRTEIWPIFEMFMGDRDLRCWFLDRGGFLEYAVLKTA